MLCQCPSCKSQLNIPDTAAGKLVQCSKCKSTVTAPSLQANPPTPLPPPPPPSPPPLPDPIDEEDEPSPFALEDQPSPYLTGKTPKKNDIEMGPERPSNPEVDPFARDTFTEEQLRTPSTHTFSVSQFLDRQRNWLIVGVVFLLVGGLFLVLMGYGVATRGIEPFGLSGLIVTSLVSFGLLGVALAAFVYCGWKFSSTPREIKIDTNGIWWRNLQGDRSATWSEITQVWRKEYIILQSGKVESWFSNVTLDLADGGNVTFDHSLTGYKELAAKIQYYTKPLLLATKTSAWEAGKAEFGPITLLTDRIAVQKGANDFFKKEDIAWKDLTHWLVQNGKLDLIGPTSTCTLELEKLPNYHVLVLLLESITGKK